MYGYFPYWSVFIYACSFIAYITIEDRVIIYLMMTQVVENV